MVFSERRRGRWHADSIGRIEVTINMFPFVEHHREEAV